MRGEASTKCRVGATRRCSGRASCTVEVCALRDDDDRTATLDELPVDVGEQRRVDFFVVLHPVDDGLTDVDQWVPQDRSIDNMRKSAAAVLAVVLMATANSADESIGNPP